MLVPLSQVDSPASDGSPSVYGVTWRRDPVQVGKLIATGAVVLGHGVTVAGAHGGTGERHDQRGFSARTDNTGAPWLVLAVRRASGQGHQSVCHNWVTKGKCLKGPTCPRLHCRPSPAQCEEAGIGLPEQKRWKCKPCAVDAAGEPIGISAPQ